MDILSFVILLFALCLLSQFWGFRGGQNTPEKNREGKEAFYRIVVADSRTKRDGKVIEQVGKYHPVQNPSFIEIDSPRAQYWLSVGAKPTQQALALLKLTGDWARFCGEENPVSRVEQPVSIEAGKSAPKSRRHSAPVAAGEATPTVSDRSDLPSVSDTPQDVPEDVRGQA